MVRIPDFVHVHNHSQQLLPLCICGGGVVAEMFNIQSLMASHLSRIW